MQRLTLIAIMAVTGAGCSSPAPRRYEIAIKNFMFEPAQLTVAVGDTIVWSNTDFVPHTATARDSTWDSNSISANGTWQLVTSAPGAHEYYCVFHPTMRAAVVVR